MFLKVLCLLVFTPHFVLLDETIFTIGGIFYEDEYDLENLKASLELSAEANNFEASVKTVRRGEFLKIIDTACSLAQENVIGIIDGLGGKGTEHIQAICDMLEIPHVVIQPDDLYTGNWSKLSMYPSAEAYNKMLTNLITKKDWNNFTLLYEKGHSIKLMAGVMEMGNCTDPFTVSVRELSGDNYRDVLIDAKEQGYTNFVVDCPSNKLEQLLSHAQQVGLMAEEHSYIFLSPDLFTLDLSRYKYGGVNMTAFRLIRLDTDLWDFTAQFNNATGQELSGENLKTGVVLIRDAFRVFQEALKKIVNNDSLSPEAFAPQQIDCSTYTAWEHGSSLLNFMKTDKVEGITNMLSFDGRGERSDVQLDILELTPSGNETIGRWENNNITLYKRFQPMEDDEESIMKNKTFKILIATIKTPPYTYLKESTQELEGNDRYEGFAVDLVEELSKSLLFNYELQEEGNYTRMAYNIRDEKADFAVCDFTITTQRQELVDFSTPFMTLGIGILYKEPSKQPPAMFSFMAVFSKEVWLWMLFIQACIGVVMIFVGRISNKEWQNPVPCIEQPEELNNQFSLANSIWLIVGSVMQQGSEIAPIALAPRMITSFWWFFTMVIVASYVGTLVAFLTITKNVLPFTNPTELLGQKSIPYGVKKGGSTETFFNVSTDSTYVDLRRNMVQMDSNDEGVERAENSGYAFFSESTAIEYYTNRHCDLLQVGDLLDSKSYGIGMKKESPYKKFIDDALLRMKESGELQRLKEKWWQDLRGGGKCGKKKEIEVKQLSMQNMKGAFVVLYVGCSFGLLISIFDMLWWVFKRSVKYNTTFKYELIEELKFAIKFQGDIKPVKRPSKSPEGSEQALAADEAAKEEAKDELGSLSARTVKSGRSGRSTSSKRSAHSHCSRHSELSVAFARRRRYD